MQKLFLSYSSKDREFVRGLQQALALSGEEVWVDFHELAGGDALWEEIQAAIGSSAHYAIVVSANSLASKWVGQELQHALQVKEERAAFRVIPISLDDATLGALEAFLGYEPKYVPASSGAGGTEAALDALRNALPDGAGVTVSAASGWRAENVTASAPLATAAKPIAPANHADVTAQKCIRRAHFCGRTDNTAARQLTL